ncbi:MAG: septal ring lytic transglycosylase RlpA family protein, partial [Inquilinus sp.]|nr:septal ring lytic transglycosylase RlpA family protein [Inquilinus sp.]
MRGRSEGVWMQLLTGYRRLAALAATLAIGACASAELAGHIAAVSQPQGQGVYKVGQPYQIEGAWYQPEEDFTYDRTGMASWYGPGFNGQLTANGEIYDQNALTAAHPTLQMPSLARVTNLRNGRTVVVRINDRGPFARDRIIDVSKRAAQLLGFIDQGTAPVRVQVLTAESRAIAERARNAVPQDPIVLAAVPEPASRTAPVQAPVMEALPREKVQVTTLAEVPSVAAASAPIAIVPGRPAPVATPAATARAVPPPVAAPAVV